MRIRWSHWLIVTIAGMQISAHAADALTPGGYENPNGELTITSSGDAQTFNIDAFGANGHTCSLEGAIHGTQAKLDAGDATCTVTFKPDAKGVDLHGDTACRFFCGMRAQFDGRYFKPAPGCASAERSKTHDAFKRSYDKKDYAAARTLLEPILAQCIALMPNWEVMSVRNDLAVTQYHLHDTAACRATLQPLATEAAKSDDELRDYYPPVDADVYLPLLKAARTNLKLCGQSSAK